ncbi:DUF397 domain-containing protein [Actinomadura fibrosa]|uniref:DUF397 domain-containing protein n=1 Tax=Actinomadura fibrosa TaxID=111802 RepID=A0ABW2XQX4_9ACTN|nr:DUF397 domain-containing protein [Actinomadura fibrosa]
MIVQWRKSTHSGGVNDQHCVELGRLPRGIGIRDSKNTSGGHLHLSVAEFSSLVNRIKETPER